MTGDTKGRTIQPAEALARAAEALSRKYRAAPEELTTLEDFERELARAEAAGELPY